MPQSPHAAAATPVTEVIFYQDVPDAGRFACALAAQAYQQGRQVIVYVDNRQAAIDFEALLWHYDQLSFVPHVLSDSPLAAQTPVIIVAADQAEKQRAAGDLFINLSCQVPDGFGACRQLLELVPMAESQRQPAREKWRHYRNAGVHPRAVRADGAGRR